MELILLWRGRHTTHTAYCDTRVSVTKFLISVSRLDSWYLMIQIGWVQMGLRCFGLGGSRLHNPVWPQQHCERHKMTDKTEKLSQFGCGLGGWRGRDNNKMQLSPRLTLASHNLHLARRGRRSVNNLFCQQRRKSVVNITTAASVQ